MGLVEREIIMWRNDGCLDGLCKQHEVDNYYPREKFIVKPVKVFAIEYGFGEPARLLFICEWSEVRQAY